MGDIDSELSLSVAGSYSITIDNTRLALSSTDGELASFDVSKAEGGVVMASWNMLRVLVQDERVRVWFNPQFSDVTGASVPPADEQSMQAMPPRIHRHHRKGQWWRLGHFDAGHEQEELSR